MLPINQLLERFKNLTNTDKVKKQLVVDILKENKIPIHLKQIRISNKVIFIKTNPIIKTEVLLRKENLLNEIKKINGFNNILDIQ